MVRRLCGLAVVFILCAPAIFAQCPTNAEAAAPAAPSDTNFAVGSNVQFTWAPSPVSGVSYDVVAWQNINSPTVVCANQAGSSCSAVFNTAGQWSWAIKTKKPTCNDVGSGAKNFTIGCLSGQPVLQSPANNATNVSQNVTLSWAAVAGADNYDVYISTNTCGVNGQLATASGTTFNPPPLNAGTTYGWRVVAKKANCPGTTSSCGTFTTAAAACNAPGSFDLRSPNNVTTSATPQLLWNGANNASKYVVHLGTSNPPQTTNSDPIVTGTSFVPQSLSPGTYFWNVDAYPSCSTTISTRSSSTFSFTVRNCPATAPQLVSPANGAANIDNPVKFDWNPVIGASSYRVLVAIDGGTPAAIGTTNETELQVNVPGSSIEWWVEANFDGCPAVASQHFHFTTTACPPNPGTPAIVSPHDGATGLTSPVSLQWSGVTGAKAYIILASFNGGASVAIAITTATQLSVSLPAGSYSWVVEAKFGD